MPITTTKAGHDHEHGHSHRASGRVLILALALALTLGFAMVELLAGWRAGSLALRADAGHMVTDGAALGLSALAAWLASLPPSRRHSYGLGKAELLAALVNALTMLAVVFGIGAQAWQRLQSPGSIDGALVGIVAILGLLVNLAVAWMLSRGEQSLNVRGALLHVMGDVLGSVAAIVAGAVIYFTQWTPIDPLLSLLIGGLILASSVRLLKEALHGVLDGVPSHIDLDELGRTLAVVPGVKDVHDLHVWPIGAGRMALSAHVRVVDLVSWPRILGALTDIAQHEGIGHVTFQAESSGTEEQIIRFARR